MISEEVNQCPDCKLADVFCDKHRKKISEAFANLPDEPRRDNECEYCDGTKVIVVNGDQIECTYCYGTGKSKRSVMEKHDMFADGGIVKGLASDGGTFKGVM